MRMLMSYGLVMVRVGVGLAHWSIMLMLVMFIMYMAMVMLDILMDMFMLVPFGEMEPQTQCHQKPRYDECRRNCIAQHENRQKRTDKGS